MRCEISIQKSYADGDIVKNIPEDIIISAKAYVVDLLMEFSFVVKCEDCHCYYDDVLNNIKYRSDLIVCSIDSDRVLDEKYIRTRLLHIVCIGKNLIVRCNFY